MSSDLKTIQEHRLLNQLTISKDIYYTSVRFCCIHIYVKFLQNIFTIKKTVRCGFLKRINDNAYKKVLQIKVCVAI